MSAPSIPPAAPAPRGLEGVVAAQTRLSHVDGLAGELIIGGYELKELAGHVSFEAAAHLLWKGALPRPAELAALRAEMARQRSLPAETLAILRPARRRSTRCAWPARRCRSTSRTPTTSRPSPISPTR